MKKINKWTENEIEYLKLNYYNLGPTECGKILNRSRGSVNKKAKDLNLTYSGVKLKYSKEKLEPIIKNSKTINEVLKKLNMRCAGGNYKTIKMYITHYNLSTEHFYEHEEKIKRILERTENNKKPLNEILIENSTYNRGSLKKRIINEKIINYQCAKCMNKGDWMGEKLILQLEHKNGVYNDNRIENLEFLCPNCHSQTNTYAGKNNKK